MAFVCAHFAAHQNQIEQRNGDMRDIYTKGTNFDLEARFDVSRSLLLNPIQLDLPMVHR